MKKKIASVLMLLILIGLTGCNDETQSVNNTAVELLEPVGVQMDIAQVGRSEIYRVTTYNGEIVPHVEELQFVTDGKLDEFKVTLGEWVTEGQVLASLSQEDTIEQMEDLKEQIADIEKTGEYHDRQLTADIEMEQVRLEQLKAYGASHQEVRLKEVDVQKLENELEQARELRQLELQEKEREWQALKKKTGNNQITAPFEGRVVYIQDIQNGSNVQGYTTVICLADENRIFLETDSISESYVKGAAKVYAKIGEKEYDIEYVPYDISDYITKMLNKEDIKTQFLVSAEDGELECGDFAVVMIFNTYKDNVLTIPVNALYQDAGGKFVYKLAEGKRIRCNVSVGTMTDTKAEITDGLEEGDFVYVKE